jgi:hypothetical protein
MSSPFKIFRKHQKVLLAVAGLMAMIAFVILPIVLQNFGMRQGGSNPVVVSTTKYGDLKQSDMQNLRTRHDRVLGVLANMISKIRLIDSQYCRLMLEQQFGSSKEEELVSRWLMARRADELGINVSNETINGFLKDYSMDKLTPQEIQTFIKQIGGQGYTDQHFFDDMRDELKVRDLQNMFFVSIQGMTPGQRWDYYCRVHQQAQIECIPVLVSQYAASFKDPGKKVLEEYFDKYKDKVHSPYASEPGFRVPQKIEFAYFKADLKKFATPEYVTDDEIQTYYEKDPKRWDDLNKKYLMKEAESAGDKKEPVEKEGDKKETPENAMPAEDAKPVEGGAAPAAPEGEKKDVVKKDGEQTPPPVEAKPTDKPAEKAPEKSSSVERSPYRFVSLLADENKDLPDQPKTDAPKADAQTTDVPKSETPKVDAPAASGEAAATVPEPSAVDAKPADAKPGETDQPESPKRQLTEEVRNQIRELVAIDKINAIFAKLEGVMKANATEWKSYDAAKIHGETGLKEPSELDFAALAKQYEVTAGKTDEITQWQAREDKEIGQSRLFEMKQQPALSEAVFDNLPQRSEISLRMPFKSESEQDGDISIYLLWKTKDIKETEPKWEDAAVQKQVLEAWQLEQARTPALEKAKKMAAEAAKGKTTLKEAFAGVSELEVIAPPPFTWLKGGYDPRNPRYDLNFDVKGVDKPGMEFMKTVFNLNEMGVGTAMNQPQTIVYVIQVEKFDPTNDDLWKRFLDDDFQRYANASMYDLQTTGSALRNELIKEAGLKWLRKADHLQKENSSDNSSDNSPDN